MTPENVAKVKAYFEEHKAEIRNDLMTLIKAESPTNNKEYVEKCAEILCGLIKERTGVKEVIKFPQEKVGPTLKAYVGDGPKKVMLLGHYDTVHNVGSFPIVEDGDTIKAPGGYDMKAGLTGFLWSVKCIKELGLPCDKTFIICCNSDEETGSATSTPIYLDGIKDYRATLIGESSQHGLIKTERKGCGYFKISIHGRAAHSGNAIKDGRSAVTEGSHVALFLDSLVNMETGTTVNVGVFQGGERRNIVCPEVYLEVDYRVPSFAEEEKLINTVMAYKPHDPDVKVDIELVKICPPMEKTPGNADLFKQLVEAGKEMGLEIGEISVGGFSDGNHTSAAGCPTIDSMGAVGNLAHTPNEYLDFSATVERMALQTIFLSNLD